VEVQGNWNTCLQWLFLLWKSVRLDVRAPGLANLLLLPMNARTSFEMKAGRRPSTSNINPIRLTYPTELSLRPSISAQRTICSPGFALKHPIAVADWTEKRWAIFAPHRNWHQRYSFVIIII